MEIEGFDQKQEANPEKINFDMYGIDSQTSLNYEEKIVEPSLQKPHIYSDMKVEMDDVKEVDFDIVADNKTDQSTNELSAK